MPHRCEICKLSFTRRFNLRRHVARKHQNGDREILDATSGYKLCNRSTSDSVDGEDDSSHSDPQSDTESEGETVEDNEVSDDSAKGDRTETSGDDSEEEMTDSTDQTSDNDEEQTHVTLSGTSETLAALIEINKAMGKILQRGLQNQEMVTH
ncbi:hypothetical protein HOLleu_16353 [Holothuria leucospilota]|uniref:C2H2-type domain-containing protein n=1 Tax=Holothuria leucospilota TaxID=206669 RepID=A0A9Q1C512_HOLLE|nr:hypothetical protein HOLleu_16353 [Holothuria leucospilota]